jgi:hypothetical protein
VIPERVFATFDCVLYLGVCHPCSLYPLGYLDLFLLGCTIMELVVFNFGRLLFCPFTPSLLDYLNCSKLTCHRFYEGNIYKLMYYTGFDFNPLSSGTRLGVGMLVYYMFYFYC